MKLKSGLIGCLVLICLVFTGCGGNSGSVGKDASNLGKPADTSDNKSAVSTEPVTLTVATTQGASMNDDEFQKLMVEPVKAKYPNITLELVKHGKGSEIEDLVAAGTTPDMLMLWNGSLSGLNELGIMGDITPLVKKFNVDLTRFETEAIDAVKIASPKGELYGLPYTQQLNALYYNRNLFDKFAVDYPKDGMTWEDAIALAKKVTRTDGGVQYYGLDPENVTRLAFPLSLSPIDTKTGKASVNTDGWRRAFETTYAIYSIPGNERGKFFQFEKEIVAMHAGINMFARLANAAEKGFDNWDVAQYPSYKDKPNTFGMVDEHVMIITQTSKHKDQAMQVLDVLTSDEVQTISGQDFLRATPLKSAKVKEAFAKGNPLYKDKHIASIFKSHPAPAPAFSKYNNEATNIVKERFYDYLAGKDLNTSIREAEEQINQMIADKK